ncbi:MAG TPA: hypothetical protein VF676_11090 [Flavobacterium sp.]|jgi:hypothetical protein
MSLPPNQQQTLFKFISLRAPELSDPEHQDRRFVFAPDLQDTVFYDAVKDRLPGETKAYAMKKAAENFTAFTSVSSLESSFKTYNIAAWVIRNRTNFDPLVMLQKVESLTDPDAQEVLALWNNLFYQVAMQQDFYVKEMLMQLLVLTHMIKQIKGKTKAETLALLEELANANVVLPKDLFFENSDTINLVPTNNKPVFSTKALRRSIEVAEAKASLNMYEGAVSELKVLSRNYKADYTKAYDTSTALYQAAVEQAYAAATPVEKEETECPSGCIVKYIEYTNLRLPDSNYFSPPKEIDDQFLKSKLSENSYYVVEELGLLKELTYEAIIAAIDKAAYKANEIIFAAMPQSPNVLFVGGMTFQYNGEAPPVFVDSSQIPYVAKFQRTSFNPAKGRVILALDLQYPGGDVVSMEYEASYPGNPSHSGTVYTDSATGNFVDIICFNGADQITVPPATVDFDFTATIALSNGTTFELACKIPFAVQDIVSGVATIINQTSGTFGDDTPAFVPNGFGIRQVGIADYKKVVAEVCCYREAEVSHIENIMAREFKSKTTTRERIEEVTTTVERQKEVENLTESATTERFEMQSEIAKLVAQQNQASAYANMHYGYGEHNTLDAGLAYANNTTKEESNSQAVIQSKELTQRAMERIVSKFREEVVTKITERFKDENSHIFDNREGDHNVSGVYRYINAVYKNQIYNYGKRLMYEFMVPQPAKFYNLAMQVVSGTAQPESGLISLPAPADPQTFGLTNAASLTIGNYIGHAARYAASVEAPPESPVFIGKAYSGQGANESHAKEFNDLKVPPGYEVSTIKFIYTQRKATHTNLNADVTIANKTYWVPKGSSIAGFPTTKTGIISGTDISKYNLDTIPVSVVGWDLGAYTLNVTVELVRTAASFQAWQIKTFDAIMAAYRSRVDEYNARVPELQEQGVAMLRSNPLFYRQIEKNTLKKNCISYLMPQNGMGMQFYSGDTAGDFSITQNQAMDNYASKVKFMEQAFEWDIMSYNFYPPYWGNRNEWSQLFQSEYDDPLFRSFMQSGMARVVVSVKPSFEKAVMHFMATGEIWNGGLVPVLGDELYMSIVDELKEQEYIIEETWETVVPTSLVGLQEGGVAVEGSGLPCGVDCEDGVISKLVDNTSQLGPEIIPPIE